MAKRNQLAKVIPIRQPWQIDAEGPFRKYRRASLVNAQFGIDGGNPLFWGYHDPTRRWNGWATPAFCREVTALIADWVNREEPNTAWWEGEVLHHVCGDGSYVDQIEPDDLGLYRFDGWTWLEASTSS